MDLSLAFAAFAAGMLASRIFGVTMIAPLALGLVAFAGVALYRGFELRNILGMAWNGARGAGVVVVILLMIGCLTSLWRQNGTIACFTYYGVKLIPPRIFILAAFLLTFIMSYALGTSFGVAATIGVILMTIARASGVNAAWAAGAVMSGLYVGDRASPASSSASLVAHETGTDVGENIRLLLRSSLVPLLLCALLYAGISLLSRPGEIDISLISGFQREFRLSLWCLLPTVLLLGMAFARLNIRLVMAVNIVFSMALTVLLQGRSIGDTLRMMLLGFVPNDPSLSGLLAGGGVKSMLEIVTLLLLSSVCTGIFEGTGMLRGVKAASARLCRRIGRFPAMSVVSLGASAVFCNQTIGAIMCRQIMAENYADVPEGRTELMLDIENSVIVLAGLVPWCIACSVPLGMLGCGTECLPFAFYLYLLPLYWFIALKMRDRRCGNKKGRSAA